MTLSTAATVGRTDYVCEMWMWVWAWSLSISINWVTCNNEKPQRWICYEIHESESESESEFKDVDFGGKKLTLKQKNMN